MLQCVEQDDVTLYKMHVQSYRTTFKSKYTVLKCYSGESEGHTTVLE